MSRDFSGACFNCGRLLDFGPGNVGRGEICPHCRADVRACFNCRFFEAKAYNQCLEPQGDRVLEKNRSNFCDYFSFSGGYQEGEKSEKQQALNELDKLFGK